MTGQGKTYRRADHRTGSVQLDTLRDEVYRQMFRLEAGLPKAEIRLAVALLRAWNALEALPVAEEQRQWLQRICPVCVQMIESPPTSSSDPSVRR